MPTRLILADDQPIVLYGLERLLRLEPDFQLVARCADGFQALVAVRRHRPDVLILDAHLAGKSGLAVLRELHREGPPIKTVLIADALEDEEVLEAFRLGVRGMLLKEFALRMVVQCIRTVRAGDPWFERHASRRALEVLLRRETDHRAAKGQLTLREAELVRMVARGLRTQEMSQRLAISAGTVKTHLHRVYRKLHVANRVGLTLYARSTNLA
jgi:two-component system nitrate/nitrite response regulator NarL